VSILTIKDNNKIITDEQILYKSICQYDISTERTFVENTDGSI